MSVVSGRLTAAEGSACLVFDDSLRGFALYSYPMGLSGICSARWTPTSVFSAPLCF